MNALFLLSSCVPCSACQVGSVAPCYLGYSLIEPWDSLSGYVHPGIVCPAFQASDWAGAFWGSLSGLWLVTFC